MAMAGLAGASWHAGLAIVAIVASRGAERYKSSIKHAFITLFMSNQVHFFLFLYRSNISSAYSDNRGKDVPTMSQQSVSMPPAVLPNNITTVHWVLFKDNMVE